MKQRALLTLVSAISLVACGGGATAPAQSTAAEPSSGSERIGRVMKRGGDSVEALFGPEGGQLELANSARIEIPPGSFEEPTTLVFKNAPATTAFLNQEDLQAIGPLVLITPDIYGSEQGEIVFSIQLGRLPEGYSEQHVQIANEQPTEAQRGYAENTTSTRWHYNRATVENGRAVARFRGLPGLRLQFVVSK